MSGIEDNFYRVAKSVALPPVFIAALFTVAKTRNHTKCPQQIMDDDDIYNICTHLHIYVYTHAHTHSGRLLSHRKNEVLPSAARWMDLEIVILSEVRERQISRDTTYT